MIVLGSYPIQDLLGRKSMDLDLLATWTSFVEYIPGKPSLIDNGHALCREPDRIYECELISANNTSRELAEIILSDDGTHYLEDVRAWAPSLDILYLLKMSHRYKKNSPHFLKTMRDIQKMRKAGAKIPDHLMDFFKRRQKETLWYEHPNLNRTKDEFFNKEDEFYIYDHDSIHETVKLFDRPAYDYYKPDTREVLTSKALFFRQPEEIKLAGVLEESYVLALERSQIPNDFKVDETKSFLTALEKVCTSITSGWFREYAWENYDAVLQLHAKSGSYVERFHRNKNLLRPFE